MDWCCNTKDFRWYRCDHADRVDRLLTEMASRGISKLIMDSTFFPERAMYWTRMAAGKGKQRIDVVAINRRASLAAANEADAEAAVYDLQEWGRICGLTGLALLRVDLGGLAEVEPAALARRIVRVAALTLQYGVRLIIAGNGVLDDERIIGALADVGPDRCTVSVPQRQLDPVQRRWVGEVYDEEHRLADATGALLTIRIRSRARSFEALDAFLEAHKEARR